MIESLENTFRLAQETFIIKAERHQKASAELKSKINEGTVNTYLHDLERVTHAELVHARNNLFDVGDFIGEYI